jgi:hypothetical protein
MAKRARLQDGPVIVDVNDNAENDYVLLTVSKERWEDDHVQVKLSRPVAAALGELLRGSVL